jgi:hypothetical protein
MESEKTETETLLASFEKHQKEARKRVSDPADSFFLAGVLPFEEGECADYIPWAFRGMKEDDRAVFLLDAYSREDVARYRKAANAGEDLTYVRVEILKSSGVKGWKNLKTRKGKQIEVGDKAFLDRCPEGLIDELHGVCWGFATGILPVEMEGLG